MALQGTLETFALPDVLRLLASTKKTGRYHLDGNRGSGSLWMRDGQVVAGEVAGAHNISELAQVAFELLRFSDGNFAFDVDAVPAQESEPINVDTMLDSAERMLDEWQQIEAVVPSLDLWVSLRAELPQDEVTIRADKWISVVGIGSGTTGARLASLLGLSELDASRTIKELIELGLVELGEAPSGASASAPVYETPAYEASAPEEYSFVAEPGYGSEPRYGEPALSLVDEPRDDFGGFGQDASVIEFTSFDTDESVEPVNEFETFDPNGLVVEEPRLPGSVDAGSGISEAPYQNQYETGFASDYQGQYATDDTPRYETEPAPEPAPVSRTQADPTDAAEIARQLANLSPKAAKAVAAAAKATTQEEREAALAQVDESEDPINRELLLKFLGSVNS